LSQDERTRGLAFSQQLSVRVLSRTWQMLLKGISEVQAANRPVNAAEMVLIRLAHAATLPTLDEALKALEADGSDAAPGLPAPRGNGGAQPPAPSATAVSRTLIAPAPSGGGQGMRLVAAQPQE